jgi:hypothetical protein
MLLPSGEKRASTLLMVYRPWLITTTTGRPMGSPGSLVIPGSGGHFRRVDLDGPCLGKLFLCLGQQSFLLNPCLGGLPLLAELPI